MRFFERKSTENQNLFYLQPEEFDRDSPLDVLAYSLGATLYVPATKNNLGEYILTNKFQELKSLVICFEDAIGDASVTSCEEQLRETLDFVKKQVQEGLIIYQNIPQIFIRIREEEQFDRILPAISNNKELITGFVIPKITKDNATSYLKKVELIGQTLAKTFYVMPILESSNIIYKETRLTELNELSHIFSKFRHLILNIRIGGTDFSKFFGLRRQKHHTIYDLCAVRDCIADIINFFLREDNNFVVSAPVWEYFNPNKATLSKVSRDGCESTTGLFNELLMDKGNGLIGKTVIHPSHVDIVNYMFVVEYEEYIDALAILSSDTNDTGAFKSDFSNKMNETKPHFNWAKKIIKRSQIYGVYNDGYGYDSIN